MKFLIWMILLRVLTWEGLWFKALGAIGFIVFLVDLLGVEWSRKSK